MIPNNVAVAEVDNHLGGTRHKMGIDTDAMAHIMTLLTNLYKDEQLACIREYSTNAWDSHIDAGTTRPIEVTTPSRLSPYLRIKDYGVGMDEDDIARIYSQYGRSTKRAQTSTNGSMGIGGKAALAYTTSFNVVGVKSGVKTFVSVSREADGTGVMEVVDAISTDEPNGVEIVIPANDFYGFESKAREFFSYWKPGMVLLNGTDPSKFQSWEKITDRLYVKPGGEDVIVMGNVAYPLDHALDQQNLLGYGRGLAAFVTMNGDDEIVFTPSREGLIYNEKTMASINGIRKEFLENIMASIQKRLDAATTHAEAVKIMDKIRTEYSNSSILGNVTWKGLVVPPMRSYVLDTNGGRIRGLQWQPGAYRNSVRGRIDIVYGAYVVYGYPYIDQSTVSSTNKRKVRQYFTDKGLGLNAIYFVNSPQELLDNVWFDNDRLIDWKDIAAIKLNTQPRSYGGGGVKYEGGYDVFVNGYWRVETVPDDAKILYVPIKELDEWEHTFSFLKKHDPDLTIIKVGANRLPKFLRDRPKAKQISVKMLLDILDRTWDTLTDTEKDYMVRRNNFGYDYSLSYSKDLADHVDDPMIKRIARLNKDGDTKKVEEVIALANMKPQVMNRHNTRIAAHAKTTDIHKWDLQTAYPLIRNGYSGRRDDAILYINAKYNANKEKK